MPGSIYRTILSISRSRGRSAETGARRAMRAAPHRAMRSSLPRLRVPSHSPRAAPHPAGWISGSEKEHVMADAAGAMQNLSGNFSTFLTLLTTQLQNQDPLNPMDSSQFTQQLVAFR